MRLARIVVGVDGSTNSDLAAELAGDLASLSGAEVVAVHAVGMLEAMSTPDEGSQDRRDELQRSLEGPWTETLRRPGVTVRFELLDGPSVGVLVDLIRRVEADLVVVGSRGLGKVPTQLLGSTSAKLVCEAPCPVMIVPPAERSA